MPDGDWFVVLVEEAEADLVHGVESVADVAEDQVAQFNQVQVLSLVLHNHLSFYYTLHSCIFIYESM